MKAIRVVLCFILHIPWIFFTAEGICPSGYRTLRTQCYKFYNGDRYDSYSVSWYAARRICKNRITGGDLISIDSHAMMDRLKRLADIDEVWIGSDGMYKFLNGKSIWDGWWQEDEPNSSEEECIEVDDDGLNDEDCGDENSFCCEAPFCHTKIHHCKSAKICPWNTTYSGSDICDKCEDGYYHSYDRGSCEQCKTINNCNKVICTGSRKNQSKCKVCNSGWYAGEWGEGCFYHCDKIANCDKVECTGPGKHRHRCKNCKQGWLEGGWGDECQRKCGWKDHFCWPGTCVSKQLTSSCRCHHYFSKTATSSETSCNPAVKPDIISCRTTMFGPNKEKKASFDNVKGPMTCKNMKDMYGNFKPVKIIYSTKAEFKMGNTWGKPYYIHSTHFGVTDFSIDVRKHQTSGYYSTLSTKDLKKDTSNGKNAKSVWDHNSEFGVSYGLTNGEKLCLKYQAKGGGYFTSKSSPSVAIPYVKTVNNHELCYKFDNAAPQHCSEKKTCDEEPLQLQYRVTRENFTQVNYSGWSDPYPRFSHQASAIEHYEIRVSEVTPFGEELQVDTAIVYERKQGKPTGMFKFSLPPVTSTPATPTPDTITPSLPRLYSILLEVKDFADNVRQARRFLLFDQTTFIDVWADKPFYIKSASQVTEYLWQTHHNDVCLTWKNHFYNEFYLHNPLLNPIKPDPHGLIVGVYEQEDGILPVSGTPNVHGIIKYLVSWSLNYGSKCNEIEVSNFLNQTFCRGFALKDGETYTFYLRPVDIVGNTLSENRTVHIDSSEPHINQIGLTKDDFRGLVVHDERDLSEMDMYFEALDPHSGILNMEWWFGIEDTGEELDTGVIGVKRIEGNCPEDMTSPPCYCPDIGLCENHGYVIPLNKLVMAHKHHGDHHRAYYFSLKVTNVARLSATEYVTILVDYSAPEVGVIHEGSIDGKDIDYTSEDSVMVHWYGFIDHESGIKMYRIGFANRCLHRDELHYYKNVTDIVEFAEVAYTEESVRVNVSFTGKMYVSIIAFNYAMDPSDSVCSDGIIRDVTPPEIYNLTISHSSILLALLCLDGHPWKVNTDMTLSQLSRISECTTRCLKTENIPKYAFALPRSVSIIYTSASADLCNNSPTLSNDTIVYLPNDHLFLTWDIDAKESQIDDFYVGIGIDPTENDSPRLIAYESTHRKTYLRKRHVGIGPGEMFYTFLKAVSRSGLETVLTIGPMLIDSTPPLYKKKPDVSISVNNILITWDEDTFYDLEQSEQISHIEYTFGITSKSNRLEWNLMTQKFCENVTCCCIMYPLADLHNKDADLGLEFYAKLFVYNNAGHFVEVDTDSFRIPSRYPPGQAIIYDVDPEHTMQFLSDMDVHFTIGTLCGSWAGFEHHENVQIEVGVGLDDMQADVIPFHMIDGSNHYCMNSSNIQADQKYYYLVKATSSGGETVSASDGISVLDVTDLSSKITVYAGIDCSSKSQLDILTVGKGSGLSQPLQFDTKFEIGGIFLILTETDTVPYPIITFNSDDILIINETVSVERISFVPYVERPKIVVSVEEGTSVQRMNFTLFRCPSTKSLLARAAITTHWTSSIDQDVHNIWYEAGIVENGNKRSPVSEFEPTYDMTHTFRNIILQSSTDYQFSIKPCTNQICLNAVFSDVFRVENEHPTGEIDSAELRSSSDKSCYDLAITWNSFQTDSDVLFYQWTVSKNDIASHIVLPWFTVQSSDVNEVTQCIEMQPHAYSNLFVCVKAFSLAGSHTVNCKTLNVIRSGAYMFNQHTVYDLDYKDSSWNSVLKVVHSSDLGNNYKFLHDSDLDIISTDSGIAGAILGTFDRKVTWYLMTSPHVPKECNRSEECHFATETEDGYAIFPDDITKTNILYFICAYSNVTVQSENIVDEFYSCSNGFIKDDDPPSTTLDMVHVTNYNGFITDTSRMIIVWNEFEDNVNASVFGYPESIQFYSYGLGNNPGKDDIRKFSNVGHSTVVISRDLNIRNGLQVYLSVKAFDYVGLESMIVSDRFIVDTTPPETGTIILETEMLEIDNVNYISSDYIVLHLNEFEDRESGISHFEIGVGTQRVLNDIVRLSRHNEDLVQLQIEDKLFVDGRINFINIKAVNNAGLGSKFVSGKLTIDKSPPAGGHVVDGHLTEAADEDFSSDLYNVYAHWKGFMDIHSNIHYYRCGFGTQPYTDNIRHFINVGLNQAITWTGPFISGQTYYTTVEACNHAGLCRTLSSDGIVLDNSPPIQGLVMIGLEDLHHRFYPHRHWLHIHWVGFEDLQSGIDHYEVCVGTAVGVCDSVQKFGSLLQTNVIKTGIDLPVNTDLYATVTAQNKVGMNVSHTSDSFRIDETPPVLEQKPCFLNPLSLEQEPAVQWEKSILKISWLFADPDSPIINNELTFLTHHEGRTPIEHVSLGAENNYVINLDHKEWLHNGDMYYVKVTACNAAGLCTTSASNDLQIDSTPPHVGGFKKPLKWKNYINANEIRTYLTLTWYGFHDQESRIVYFSITASRNYSGQELTGGVFQFKAENISYDYETEIPLVEKITQDELLILTIWAENQVGLKSSAARISVNVLSETKNENDRLKYGKLEIEKHSCDTHFCNKDCTCAVQGQACIHVELNSTCIELDSTVIQEFGYPMVDLRFGYKSKEKQTLSPSSACLSGAWKLINVDSMSIERYEWSMGLANQPVGEGIFDLKAEQIWDDVGLREEITHCLPVNRSLLHAHSYILYVRAWYSRDKYATFQSGEIAIDQSAPSVKRGRFIKDSDVSCMADFDFIDWTDHITGCWFGVFGEQQGSISHYTVAFGTLPHADDVFKRTNVGLDPNITLSNMSLTHGTRYYFTVTAFNTVGLSTTLTSDGFLVDTDSPLEGIVYNSLHWKNMEFQSSNSSMSVSWNGFVDHFSGILRYYVAVSESNDKEATETLAFMPVALQNLHTFGNINLQHNETYYAVVKASDAAGHFSAVAFSTGITIDTSKPYGYKCKTFDHIVNGTFLLNRTAEPKFDLRLNVTKGDLFRVLLIVECNDYHTKILMDTGTEKKYLHPLHLHDRSLKFEHTFFADISTDRLISFIVFSEEELRMDYMVSKCRDIEIDNMNAISVAQLGISILSIDMLIADKESGLCSLVIGAGSTEGSFQVKALTKYHHQSNHATIRTNVRHGNPIYVTAIAENCAGLRSIFRAGPITMDHTAPTVDDVQTSVIISSVSGTPETYVMIEATWQVNDDESGIKYCFCALETHPGARDISPFWEAGTHTSCSSKWLKFREGSHVHVSVKCVNNVELYTVYTTDPHILAHVGPKTENGKVYILPSDSDNSCKFADTETFVQTSRSAVKIGWSNFESSADIAFYEYRLSFGGSPIVHWQVAAARDFVVLDGLSLNKGRTYTAEVKATDVNGLTSDTLSANVIVLEEKLRVTGKSVILTRQRNQMHLDWSHVFTTFYGIPVSYSLVIGTRKGYADVTDIVAVTYSTKTVTIPVSTLLTPKPTDLYIRISCSYPFGLEQLYEKTFKI